MAAPALGSPESGHESPATRPEPLVEARLQRMSATLTSATAFTVRTSTLHEGALASGQRVLLGGSAAIAVRKPDRLAASVGSDLGSFTLSYDGSTVTLLNPAANVYAASPLSGDLERAVGWLEDRLGIDIAVRPFLAADPHAALVAGSETTGVLVGRSVVRGIAVDHFALRNPAVDWEIWLEAGSRALPLRVSLMGRGEDSAGRITIEFEDWNLSPRLAANAFNFVPPPGAVPATLALRPEGASP
nr:DUF2092 domain-containing protein [uncultured Roseococcus sp.]